MVVSWVFLIEILQINDRKLALVCELEIVLLNSSFYSNRDTDGNDALSR